MLQAAGPAERCPERMDRVLSLLLVDDSAPDAFLTVKLLERDKPDGVALKVRRARGLAAAAAALAAERFDCVLLDWNLPDGRGRGNIARLRAVAPQAPIVVLSGFASAAAQREALDEGAQAFVLKQALGDADNLYARVAQLVRASRAGEDSSHED